MASKVSVACRIHVYIHYIKFTLSLCIIKMFLSSTLQSFCQKSLQQEHVQHMQLTVQI